MVQQLMKWKKKVHIQSFLRKELLKGGNAAITQLLNLLAIRDVSANADVLKACLDRPYDLIKECWNVLKCVEMLTMCWKFFVSICTNGASTYIGCNDSFLARVVEVHSKLYWVFARRWFGHLVKTLQRPVNKFGICLTDIKTKTLLKRGKKWK